MNKRLPIILASGSPRRAKILTEHNIPFTILKTDTCEHAYPEDPTRTVLENARAKCEAAIRMLANAHPKTSYQGILAADTIVWYNNRIYGKPRTLDEATQFLHELSGQIHSVFTGIVFQKLQNVRKEKCVQTRVRFQELSNETIANYIEKVKPLDRAGAYDIDESGNLIVANWEGSYENVMGLPSEVLPGLGLEYAS